MTPLQQIAAALNWNLRINENFVAVSPAGMYGRDPATTTGLTWGYLGGNFSGVAVPSGTVTLTASATNYVVANRTTGVVTSATTTTNWLATGTYLQLYQIVAGASTVTSYDDFRQAIGGASGGGGMSNPMTTTGDMIYSSPGSTPVRLGIGTNGWVLTVAGGVPTWAVSASGFANPMTTAGDLIVGGASGAAGRYAAGTSGFVLTANGAGVAPTWQASTGGAFTGGTLASALNEAPPVTLASAATVNIGAAAGNSITVTGTTAITAFDTIAAGALRHVTFSGVLVLTYNATSMILPGAASITTAAGDVAEMVSLDAGNWKCNDYVRASGSALVSGGGGLTGFTTSVNSSGPNITIPASIMQGSGAASVIDAVFSAKGNGAFQVQVADATAAGGNKRGSNSVDLQSARATAASVASGSNAFIGSGYNSEASGSNSCVVTGDSNRATNTGGILCGYSNITSGGNYNAVLCGNNNTASGTAAAVLAGDNNLADGGASTAFGTRCTVRGMLGAMAHAGAPASSYAQGGRQRRMNTLQVDTSNATTTAVTVDGNASNAVNQFKLVPDSGLKVKGQIGVRNTSTGNCGWWEISGACKNVGGTVTLSGTPVISAFMGDAALSTCVVAIVADNTARCLQVTVTGIAATSLIWLAELTTIEIVS